MAGWLRKQREHNDSGIPRSDLQALLPASALAPEVNRLTPIGTDVPDDAPDVDLEFLSALADEVAREAARVTATSRTPELREASSDASILQRSDEAMQYFRDMTDDRETDDVRRRYAFKVAEIEIGDLLEDLTTTVSALRRRRAA